VRIFTILVLLGLAAIPALSDPLAITTAPLDRFALLSNATSFGPFNWRGGLELTSSNTKFGGLSGLMMAKDCTSMVAVSDAGRWISADVDYTGDTLSGLSAANINPILDSAGKPPLRKALSDAEALAAGPNGMTIVGFESKTRVGFYDLASKGFKAKFQKLNPPREIANGPGNGELESVGYFNAGPLKGNYIAIAEKNLDANGNAKAWVWNARRSTAFSIHQLENYNITDIAVLQDGDILILQRSFNLTSLPGAAITRLSASSIAKGKTAKPDTLFEARVPFYAIDNMEGITVCERGGETRVTLVSDNNFNGDLQRTLLLQFSYAP
jgi:hypothetical protein